MSGQEQSDISSTESSVSPHANGPSRRQYSSSGQHQELTADEGVGAAGTNKLRRSWPFLILPLRRILHVSSARKSVNQPWEVLIVVLNIKRGQDLGRVLLQLRCELRVYFWGTNLHWD